MNKTCACCGLSLPIEDFRQRAEGTSNKCTKCESQRFCTYCGKDKSKEDFGFSGGRPHTVCLECEVWKDIHLKKPELRIEIEYHGF